MRVFVLGGTGSIGVAIVCELIKRSHQVVALCRSATSEEKLMSLGASPIRGDMSKPTDWVEAAFSCEAIIQVAATFADDMGDVDATAMAAVMNAAKDQDRITRLIYTGGCWLYGETGNEVATEGRPFNPLCPFLWMVSHAEMLIKAPGLSTAVIHPAMVYHAGSGGAFSRYFCAARANRPIEVWGSPAIRWPLIERNDLARAYCDLVERSDLVGHFNAVAEQGVAVGEIALSIAQAYGSTPGLVVRHVDQVIAKNGSWAKGPTLDQQMSAQKLRAATGWEPTINDYRRSGVIG